MRSGFRAHTAADGESPTPGCYDCVSAPERLDGCRGRSLSNGVGPFDRILLDAPCSNTGVMRRRVDVRWRLTPADFVTCRNCKSPLRGDHAMLKAGGVLVYSTCSLESEENEEVVARLQKHFPGPELLEKKSVLPFRDHSTGRSPRNCSKPSLARSRLHPPPAMESLIPMHDARFDKLAKLLVEYSTTLKRGETVLIETFDAPEEMTIALIRAARAAGALPFAQLQRARVNRELALNATERQLNLTAIHELARMKKMDAYIAIRGSQNITELSDVPAEQMKLLAKKMRPVQDQRVRKTKWVVLRWPTPSMAQLAGMSTEAFFSRATSFDPPERPTAR